MLSSSREENSLKPEERTNKPNKWRNIEFRTRLTCLRKNRQLKRILTNNISGNYLPEVTSKIMKLLRKSNNDLTFSMNIFPTNLWNV